MIIFRQAAERILKNKVRFIIMMIMPLLFIVLFAMQTETSLIIDIVDEDSSVLSGKLADNLRSIRQFKVSLLDEDNAYDRIYSYQSNYCIIIGPGFEKSIMEGKEPEISEFYVFDKEKLYFARLQIESYISDLKLMAAGVGYDRNRFMEALKDFEDRKLTTANVSASSGRQTQTRTSMGFMIQFMLYMSVITAGILIEDKSSGVFYRVFYAPVSLKTYIAENLAAFTVVGILQVTVILSVLKWGFGFYFGSSPVSFFLLLAVFALFCITLGTWIVSLFKKPLYAYLAILCITTPLLMLGGCYWPKEFMTDTVNSAARFLPTTWVMQGVDKLIYDGKTILDLGLEVFILLIFTGIFLAAGLVRKVDISK